MKKILLKLLMAIVFVAISLIGGNYLTHLMDIIPCGNITEIFPCSNMPHSVEMLIRFALSITGNDSLANPDDMEILAMLFYWIIATLLVGVILFLCGKAVSRHYRARKFRGQLR